MDRQKSRKGHESRKYTCDFPVNENNVICNEKGKYKRHVYGDKKKYEMSPNSYSMNWSPQPRLHVAQRPFSTSESSVCHYSVPLSFSFEPVSLPIYPALVRPQGSCSVPLEMENHFNISKHHKTHRKNKKNKINSIDQNDVPAIFHTPRINNGDQQDFTSLPPVNCDIYAGKTSDPETACKRRFSDPGLGQMSSNDCSSTRSDESSSSSETAEVQSNDFFGLIEQVNELKEDNNHLKKELYEVKLELESLKIQSQTWKTGHEDFTPGALSDAVNEIRNAVKLGEEALIGKVIQMVEKNSLDFKEAHGKLEEKLRQEMNERLNKMEEQMTRTGQREEIAKMVTTEVPAAVDKDNSPSFQQQLVELEQEKIQLRKELQEAIVRRKTAEATTEKLERLVGILKKKINGVSLESWIPEDKQILVRPLASSLEKNPFIIANNRQGQKADTLPFQKPKISTFKVTPLEGAEGTNPARVNENKENETGESGTNTGTSNRNPIHGPCPSETTSVTAQVTITGPVTDL